MAAILLIEPSAEDLAKSAKFFGEFVDQFATFPMDWEPYQTNQRLSRWRDKNILVSYHGNGDDLSREARQWFDSVIDFRRGRYVQHS